MVCLGTALMQIKNENAQFRNFILTFKNTWIVIDGTNLCFSYWVLVSKILSALPESIRRKDRRDGCGTAGLSPDVDPINNLFHYTYQGVR